MLPRSHPPLLALLLLAALACDGSDAPGAAPSPAPQPARRDRPQAADPAPEPHAPTLCERLDAERGALDLGGPLHARVTSFEARARAWLTRTDVSPAVRGALEALLLDRTSRTALAALHDARADFAADPTLPVDATLTALVATDAAPPSGSNERVLALLAEARGWLPGDPAIPWVEALLVPERGGRRALLDQAFAAGARDPALLSALARAAMRDGDAAAALAALDALPAADTSAAQEPPRGGALRERAEATQRALATLHRSELSGVTVWAPSSLPVDIATQLAGVVRSDLDAAARLLGGPARPRLVVWAHASLDDFGAATCGTSWSQAFYDGVLHVVLAGPQLEPALLRSARHEALHAQLDFLTPLAPRWLQEGLAQRFAQEPFDSDATAGATPLTARDLVLVERDLGLGSDGATAGAAYTRARLAIEQLVARSGEGELARAVAGLRSGLPPAALPQQLGFASN